MEDMTVVYAARAARYVNVDQLDANAQIRVSGEGTVSTLQVSSWHCYYNSQPKWRVCVRLPSLICTAARIQLCIYLRLKCQQTNTGARVQFTPACVCYQPPLRL
eukprot:17472-Heterococcus_DN1.PRE.1